MKRALGWIALVATLACGAEPARAPMEWASVHPEAIAAWKEANRAPDGVVVDAVAHAVRILVEATGLGPADTAEFFAIGPLSDRAYESFFVTVASPAAIADAIERAGVPRGVPPDIAGARLWPCGEKLALTATPVATNAPALAFADLLTDTAEKEEGAILSAPVVYTGARRVGRRRGRHEHPVRRICALQPHAVASAAERTVRPVDGVRALPREEGVAGGFAV